MFNNPSAPPALFKLFNGGKKKLKFKDSAIYKFKFWFINLAISLYHLKTYIAFFFIFSKCQLCYYWAGLSCSQGTCLCTCQSPIWKVVPDNDSEWQSKIVHPATLKFSERLLSCILIVQFQFWKSNLLHWTIFSDKNKVSLNL